MVAIPIVDSVIIDQDSAPMHYGMAAGTATTSTPTLPLKTGAAAVVVEPATATPTTSRSPKKDINSGDPWSLDSDAPPPYHHKPAVQATIAIVGLSVVGWLVFYIIKDCYLKKQKGELKEERDTFVKFMESASNYIFYPFTKMFWVKLVKGNHTNTAACKICNGRPNTTCQNQVDAMNQRLCNRNLNRKMGAGQKAKVNGKQPDVNGKQPDVNAENAVAVVKGLGGPVETVEELQKTHGPYARTSCESTHYEGFSHYEASNGGPSWTAPVGHTGGRSLVPLRTTPPTFDETLTKVRYSLESNDQPH